MDRETALVTILPLVCIAGGLLLLWSVSRARRSIDSGVPRRVEWARTIGAALALVGVFVLLTFMTHGLAFFFWFVALAVVVTSVYRFREGERKALLWVIVTAAERGIPLHLAVRAMATDRPDRLGDQIERLADFLEAGMPLGLSLQRAGIHVSPTARLAADLGQQSGNTGTELRTESAASEKLEASIQSLLHWMGYITFVAACILIIVIFSIVKIVPVFAHIYREFEVPLPRVTQGFEEFATLVSSYWFVMLLVVLIALGAVLLVFAQFVGYSVRQLPVLHRLWLRTDGALVLRWLAASIRQKRPMPEFMRLLAGYFPRSTVRHQLEKASRRIDRGGEWIASLQQFGLIGKSESALFYAAERTGNLPWALEEMADSRLRRFAYSCRVCLDLFFPLVLILFGAIVLCVALAMLMPLFSMITHLAGVL